MRNTFSLIVPAYKEEDFIENALTGFAKEFRENHLEFEIITVIDVVQNDKTFEIAKGLEKKIPEIKIIAREGRRGIANAIKDGIDHSSNDVIIFAMAENSQDSKDLVKMALKMNDGYDMIIGNRFSDGKKLEQYSTTKLIANRLCNFAIRILFGIKSSDVTNGLKAYKSKILKQMPITSQGFEVFVELPLKAYKKGYKNFVEIPVNYYGRDLSLSKFELRREGPKYFKMILKCFFNY